MIFFICSLFSSTVNEKHCRNIVQKSTISLLNLIQSWHSCSKNIEWTRSSYTDCWRGVNLLLLDCMFSFGFKKYVQRNFEQNRNTSWKSFLETVRGDRYWIATTIKQNLRFVVLPFRMWNGTECQKMTFLTIFFRNSLFYNTELVS